MNTVNQLRTVKAHTATKVANELTRTGGLLRLAPAWVPRSFLQPGLRQAAKNVEAQSRAWKLPVVVWHDGKVVAKPA